MIKLKAQKREKTRRDGIVIPAVLYGPKIEALSIELNLKEFKNLYEEAGESTLITLLVDDKEFLVLVKEVSLDPLTNEPSHVDFYQPLLDKKVEAEVPIIFIGESPAVKDLGGTIVKEMHELQVSALPQNLPHEIEVDLSVLINFETEIKIKDLKVSEGVEILREPDDMVASVQPPQKIEEELEKPIEENVEGVEKITKEKSEEENVESV